jgi:hypothetical protein
MASASNPSAVRAVLAARLFLRGESALAATFLVPEGAGARCSNALRHFGRGAFHEPLATIVLRI